MQPGLGSILGLVESGIHHRNQRARREIERTTLIAPSEGHISIAVHLQVYARPQRPAVAEIGAVVRIQGIVNALDLDGEAGGRHHQIRDGSGHASGLIVAANRDHDGTAHCVAGRVGSVKP